MTSMADDLDALYRMLDRVIPELREKDPEHPLLKFAGPVRGRRQFTREEWFDYLEQFAKDEKTTVMQAQINYLIAVEVALGKREAPTAASTT